MAGETLDPTVFVIEDDADMRRSLERYLQSEGLKVDSYESPRHFLQAFSPSVPGCLVIDLRLPGMSGLELYDTLRSLGCDLPFIMITGHGEVPCTVEAIQYGALDFIEKPFPCERLLRRIRQAIELNTQSRRERAARAGIESRLESLTAREREILDYVLAGRLSKEIARELGISIKTVEVHRSKLMRKMKAESVHELVRMTIEANYSAPSIMPTMPSVAARRNRVAAPRTASFRQAYSSATNGRG